MLSKKPRFLWQISSFIFVVFLSIFPTVAQDPDPNSPTPILLSQSRSLRALATTKTNVSRRDLSKLGNQSFRPNSKVTLFVTNIDLMSGEGANAFRVYVEDQNGRRFRFPVLDIRPVIGQPEIYALTTLLSDELGFWQRPEFENDVKVGVAWRGLASNRVRLGIGGIGGLIKDDAGAVPTSITDLPAKISKNKKEINGIGYQFSGDRIRFLEQAAFGPTPDLDFRLRRLGLRVWLGEQFAAPYPTNPYPNLALMPTTVPTTCDAICRRDFYSMYPVQNWFYKEAFYGDAQLRHRVAWALSQIWVISGNDVNQASWMTAYHQKLSENAFGNYRDLMNDITLNPGMGNYLDMAGSTRNNPNENFPRENLQLFTIGLFMLNQDGTRQLDSNDNPIPTYDQNTVNNFTKVFTGWSFCNTGCPNSTPGSPNYKDPMVLNQNNHDITAKTLLNYPGAVNVNLPPNQNGATDLNQTLDNIFNHPNVAPFVSRLLIQHLVTSDPTPAYVGRIAAIFNNNGSNVRGDLKEVVRAILLDPEARGDFKTDPDYGKLREPTQLATCLLRQFGVQSADGATQSDGVVNQIVSPLGQSAFLSPSVFNYYSPSYVIPGTALNGPEFGTLNTGTAIARANFINTMVFNRVNVSTTAPLGTSINFAEIQSFAAADASNNQLLDVLNTRMMHGAMSAEMRNTILTAVQAVPTANTLLRVQTAIYLIATSSQYQVQR